MEKKRLRAVVESFVKNSPLSSNVTRKATTSPQSLDYPAAHSQAKYLDALMKRPGRRSLSAAVKTSRPSLSPLRLPRHGPAGADHKFFHTRALTHSRKNPYSSRCASAPAMTFGRGRIAGPASP